MDKKNIIDAVGHCIGYGPIDAKYCFFGLEEKGKFNFNDTNRISAYLKKYKNEKNKYYSISNEEIYSSCIECKSIDQVESKKSKIYPAYLKIYKGLANGDIITPELLGSSRIPILLGNLFPFGKERNYDSYAEDENRWIEINQELRTEMILKFLIDRSKVGYVFCFGSMQDYLDYFCKYIDFGDSKSFNSQAHSSQIYYKANDVNLYLLRHPSNGWLADDQIKELIIKLNT
jgi:hypothetical protein